MLFADAIADTDTPVAADILVNVSPGFIVHVGGQLSIFDFEFKVNIKVIDRIVTNIDINFII